MTGWTYDQVRALPQDVYTVIVETLNREYAAETEADDEAADPESALRGDAWR